MYICQYCGKECKNLNSLKNHERCCRSNPNRNYKNGMLGKTSWNKGLTKETDTNVLKQALSLKKYLSKKENRIYGRHPSKETIEKIRNSGCGGFREKAGRGKKGNYKGLYCDSTYELVWTIYCLDHNIKFKRCPRQIHYTYIYKERKYKYYPDYLLEDGSLIEIKGYHNAIVDLKTASVKDRKIKVLYEKDIKYMFDYVKENYSYTSLEDLYD